MKKSKLDLKIKQLLEENPDLKEENERMIEKWKLEDLSLNNSTIKQFGEQLTEKIEWIEKLISLAKNKTKKTLKNTCGICKFRKDCKDILNYEPGYCKKWEAEK